MRIVLIPLILAILSAGCGAGNDYRTLSGAVWGTTFHITYDSEHDLSDSIFATMERIDNSLSMFNPHSAVSRINRGESVRPDSDLLCVWRISEAVNKVSCGAFDPTVAPLVDLWGFGRKGRKVPVPDSAEIAATMAGVGMHKWTVLSDSAILRPSDAAALDFSAVAKGYGVDCIAQMLRRNGCKNYMVEVGGEIALAGRNSKGRMWRVQIDAPIDTMPGSVAASIIDTTDCGIATSGNYRNYRSDSAGTQYGHTIDPRTGYPRSKAFRSVTVIAGNCALADALATAMMASDPDTAMNLTDKFSARVFTVK
ncbi:MAG: FAD:protein FMN transferase [Muribaculaceae bacterium]|nr:FAD:protein FMN transferase [Muribaculaceae bacterium]